MSERVFIVGAGHVGRGLWLALQNARVELVGLHGRRASSLASSYGVFPPALRNANVVVVCVRDPELDGALDEITQAASEGRLERNTVVLHTSAIAEPPAIPVLSAAGYPAGTFHPLVPFAEPTRAAALLKGGWIGIDGENAARAVSRRLAAHLGARTLDIPPGGKPAYHAAAVLASNFPVVLASVAGHLLTESGVSEASAWSAVHALMAGAVGNMKETLPDDALTGPVVRGDAVTVARHLKGLRSYPQALAIYRLLSSAAIRIAERNGLSAERVASLTAVLGGREKPG